MKTELQEQCTICYEILISPEQITTKEILKKLRLLVRTIDLTLLQHKPICKACLVKIKSACKFKSTYLDLQENCIKVKNEEDQYSHKWVFCEICKDIVNSSDSIPLFDPLSKINKSIIINHLCPKLESIINEDPQTCESCHKSMLNFCNITNLLSIFDLVCDKNESESVTVKKELQQSDIASTSANSERCNLKVKDEVIPVVQYMKVEKDSIEYDEFIAKNEELDLKMDCEEEPEEEGKWTHADEETGKNFLNTSTISQDNDMVEFKTNETVETKIFQCKMCDFKTNYKCSLKNHMLIHKNPEEVEIFYCNKCDYKARQKRYLNRHMRIHKNSDEIELFQCEMCEFKTAYKCYLATHMLQHKKPDTIEMFQCKMCDFKTKYKSNIRNHMIIHKKPEEIDMFHCNFCEYKTRMKSYLNKHMFRIHNKADETRTFQCATCTFKTIHKSSLITHMIQHQKPNEGKTFHCNRCDYNTKDIRYLNRHMLRYKKPDEIELFYCDICKFHTKYKNSLKWHNIRVHKKSEELVMFHCNMCDYSAKDKRYLNRHMIIHKKSDEIEKFQCAICKYVTIHKASLKRHMLRHKKT